MVVIFTTKRSDGKTVNLSVLLAQLTAAPSLFYTEEVFHYFLLLLRTNESLHHGVIAFVTREYLPYSSHTISLPNQYFYLHHQLHGNLWPALHKMGKDFFYFARATALTIL